jgi:uncharacterized membrane protein YeaQ/YmgE (transglycosylase-associated protein family)
MMRTSTSEGILIDVSVGGLGAVVLCLLIASSATLDNIVAAYLGSVIGVTLLYFVRSLQRGLNRGSDL